MYIEGRTKKIAKTALLFAALSVCLIGLCTAAVYRHNASLLRSANVPIYTYQNPFSLTENVVSAPLSGAQPEGVSTKPVIKWALRLISLAVPWVASIWYLNGGRDKKKQAHRKVRYAMTNTPAKMNRLAAIPNLPARAIKQDKIRPPVLWQTGKHCSFAHRRTTAPCQSRFRPVTLVSSQTRLGRLR